MRAWFGPIVMALLLGTVPDVRAQTPAASPAFDVATVRAAAPLDIAKIAADFRAGKMPDMGAHVEGSEARYRYMSLKDLIALAYKVQAYQVSGPDWLGSERFDIMAKLPEGASKDDVPAMLQGLLADRFKLTVRRDTQEHPVLALVVAKGGPKLKEAPEAAQPLDESAPLKAGQMKIQTPDGPAIVSRNADGTVTTDMGVKGTFTQKLDPRDQTMRIEGNNLTMRGFAQMLTQMQQMGGSGGRQVVDMTGLKGSYQVTVALSLPDLMAMARAQGIDVPEGRPGGGANGGAGPIASDPGGGSTVFASVQALGLKLESRKAPVEQLVVDHVDKAPTEN